MIKPGDEPIPGYRVEELLGSGQFGQVWRAKSPGNLHVALKFLDMDGRHGRKEFRAIQRVKQIRHAHLMPIVAIWLLDKDGNVLDDDAVDVIAASQQDSQVAIPAKETLVAPPVDTNIEKQEASRLIVANLLANQTLGDRLKECRESGLQGIPVDELISYMEEAAKGLDFLNSSQHQIGDNLGAVQHCDVKPENIMLTGGSVVISDFGVAQMLAESRRQAKATSLGGTPAYMAPELFSSKPSPTTDQYSLAASYYELRTGKLPFRELTYAAVYEAHKTGSLDFSDVGSAEQQVLRKATATDPGQRYQSCGEFVAELKRAVHPEESPGKVKFLAIATVLGLIVAAGAVFVSDFWRKENNTTPPPPPIVSTYQASITVNPPEVRGIAQLSINGEQVELSNGQAMFEAEQGQSLSIQVTASDHWQPHERDISAAEAAGGISIKLKHTAKFYKDKADAALDGRYIEAVGLLAQAIKRDPQSYSRVPPADVRPTGGNRATIVEVSPDGRRVVTGTEDGIVRQWLLSRQEVDDGAEASNAGGEILLLDVNDQFVATVAERPDEYSTQQGDGQGDAGSDGADGQEDLLPTIFLTSLDAEGRRERLVIPDVDQYTMIKSIWFDDQQARLFAVTELLGLPLPGEIDESTTAMHYWSLVSQDVADTYALQSKLVGETWPRVAHAPHQDWVALSTQETGGRWIVRKHSLSTGEAVQLFKGTADVNVSDVSSDGRLIAIGGGASADNGDGGAYRVTLIDAASGESVTLGYGYNASITVTAFSPTGRQFASGSSDGQAQLWTFPDDWQPPVNIAVNPNFLDRYDSSGPAVRDVAFLWRNWVACLYDDGSIALFDGVDSGQTPLALGGESVRFVAIAATPDGNTLIAATNEGEVWFWDARQLTLFKEACDQAGMTPQPLEAIDSAA